MFGGNLLSFFSLLQTYTMSVIIQDVAVIIIIFSLKKKENMNLWFLLRRLAGLLVDI